MSARPLLERLLMSVRELSLSGEVAVAQGGVPADELAVRFEALYTDYVGSLTELPSESQLMALQALDTAIHQLTGVENAPLWEEGAVRSDPRWHELREIARIALAAFEG